MHEKIIPMRIFRENAYLSRFIKTKETIYLKIFVLDKIRYCVNQTGAPGTGAPEGQRYPISVS